MYEDQDGQSAYDHRLDREEDHTLNEKLAEPVSGAVDLSSPLKWLIFSLCGMVLFLAMASPLLSPFSMSQSWELAALVVTGALCFYIWVDIWIISRQRIKQAIDSGRSTLFVIVAGFVVFLLLVAVGFAFAPWGGPFEPMWNLVVAALGRFLYAVHATVLFVGALAAAGLSKILADPAAENPAVRSATDPTVVAAREALREEIIASRRAFWFADVPACLAFGIICVTAWCACIHKGSMHQEELKSFIGGSVAMSLVLTNTVHVSLRLRR